MINYIQEIELNTCNLCGANCIFCSRFHGCGNVPYMQPNVFAELIKQLKDVKMDIIQTSGNGETFLNPHYIDYIRTLKKEFPNVPRWIYNNFSLLDKEKADIIVNEKLFDKIHTRIDSMQNWIFSRSSNLNMNVVFENIKYFMSINNKIPFIILYNNIKKYYEHCIKIIGKRPMRDYFTDEELEKIKDEFDDVSKFFIQYSKTNFSVCRIGHCLWGERFQAPKNENALCPKINVIEKVCWILPNGNLTVCCYDDTQDKFIYGNIMENHILDLFYGEKRKEIINNIKKRVYKDYPCTNPKCCSFGEGIEEKN